MSRRLASIVAFVVLSTVISFASVSSAHAGITVPCTSYSSSTHCTWISVWYSSTRGDYFLTTKWREWEDHTRDGGYVHYSSPGLIADPSWPQPPGTIALWNWYSPSREDNFATTEPGWVPNGPNDTRESGGLYMWPSLLGYVWTTRVSSCVTFGLDLWWNPVQGDNALVSTIAEPQAPYWGNGYYYVGRQGYYDGGPC